MTSRGILLDIEGTTTSVSFVYDVLFPFARNHLEKHFQDSRDDIPDLKREYEQESNPPPWSDPPIAYVHWLMDQDRKSSALKSLQGKIWRQGYRGAELRGEVFDDVPDALERWQSRGIDVRIFSSGSELAQQLLFSTTRFGDLTRLLKGYFDTRIGAKTDTSSYSRIAAAFRLPPGEILFISDLVRELDAARSAGMQTLLCMRPGNHPPGPHSHREISSFELV